MLIINHYWFYSSLGFLWGSSVNLHMQIIWMDIFWSDFRLAGKHWDCWIWASFLAFYKVSSSQVLFSWRDVFCRYYWKAIFLSFEWNRLHQIIGIFQSISLGKNILVLRFLSTLINLTLVGWSVQKLCFVFSQLQVQPCSESL